MHAVIFKVLERRLDKSPGPKTVILNLLVLMAYWGY
jgi:hypothetical protein